MKAGKARLEKYFKRLQQQDINEKSDDSDESDESDESEHSTITPPPPKPAEPTRKALKRKLNDGDNNGDTANESEPKHPPNKKMKLDTNVCFICKFKMIKMI